MQVEEQTNDSVEITSTGVAVDKTPDVVSISASEYEEYRKYKDRLSLESKGGHKSLSINERVSRELAEVQERAALQDKLLREATRINEIDTLASKYLSNHFNKEALLSKGYSLDEILLAQSRELIRKYVSPEQIKAIAKVESTEHIEGHILEQLLDLAKVHIKQRQNNENIRTASRLENNGVKFKEQISISNSNFRPINRTELTEGMIQFYINQQKQNSKRIIKRSA
ncbi:MULTISPECIES: DUF1357 family protein [Borrelia]|uniref:Uncharacterized protein n=4 Tax=Borrelia TaxID=138 RepID=W5SBB4_9SPIR|nr:MULTISPECIES: DUF1357 family protein [Borrelia]AHH04252.1 Hypothetical protein BHY_1301 [Borrelia nietonii YOR]ANA44042.1 hypothetical protein AXX13_R02 [Borrelia hermsii HS1]UPA09581.1 DUF1357 family protein [Borrelia nietonii YOR]